MGCRVQQRLVRHGSLCGHSRTRSAVSRRRSSRLEILRAKAHHSAQSRWWKGSQKHTKDGTLNATAAIYFLALKEHVNFSGLLELLASADEFRLDPELLLLRAQIAKPGVDEYARLTATVREGVEGKDGWTGYANWDSGKKRARVLIAAHLLRIPIKSLAVLRGQLSRSLVLESSSSFLQNNK